MKKLSKEEVKSRYINDMYRKKLEKKQRAMAADTHLFDNSMLIREKLRRHGSGRSF